MQDKRKMGTLQLLKIHSCFNARNGARIKKGRNLLEEEENTERLLCASHCTRYSLYCKNILCDLYNKSTEKLEICTPQFTDEKMEWTHKAN